MPDVIMVIPGAIVLSERYETRGSRYRQLLQRYY